MIRNLSVRSKLIGILIAPLLALTLLTSLGIGANLAVKVEAEHLRQEAAFTKNLSRLVHELQAERDLSAGWVSGDRASEPSWPRKATLDDQQSHVNEDLKAFGNDTQALENDGSAFYRQAQKAQAGFSGLNELRQKVENNSPGTTAEEVLDSYSDLIGNLLAVNFEIARNADNHTLTRSVAAFVAMARLKEAASPSACPSWWARRRAGDLSSTLQQPPSSTTPLTRPCNVPTASRRPSSANPCLARALAN